MGVEVGSMVPSDFLVGFILGVAVGAFLSYFFMAVVGIWKSEDV